MNYWIDGWFSWRTIIGSLRMSYQKVIAVVPLCPWKLVPGPAVNTKIHGCSSPVVGSLYLWVSHQQIQPASDHICEQCIYWKKICIQVDLQQLKFMLFRISCLFFLTCWANWLDRQSLDFFKKLETISHDMLVEDGSFSKAASWMPMVPPRFLEWFVVGERDPLMAGLFLPFLHLDQLLCYLSDRYPAFAVPGLFRRSWCLLASLSVASTSCLVFSEYPEPLAIIPTQSYLRAPPNQSIKIRHLAIIRPPPRLQSPGPLLCLSP